MLPVPLRTIFGRGAAEPVPVQVPEEEAKLAHKRQRETQRQRERREEKREAKRLGKAWESPYAKPLPATIKTKRQRQRRGEQASAEAAGLDWVPQSKYSLPAPIVENAATCPVLVGTVQTISRHWAPLLPTTSTGVPTRIQSAVQALMMDNRLSTDFVSQSSVDSLTLHDDELMGEISHGRYVSPMLDPFVDHGDWSLAAFKPRSVVVRPPIPATVIDLAEKTLSLHLKDQGPAISVRGAQAKNRVEDEWRDTLLESLLREKQLDHINIFNPTQGQMCCTPKLPGCLHTLGGNTTCVNGCARSQQPKRMSRSVVVDEDTSSYLLYNYTSYGRAESDFECRPMCWPWFLLMCNVWLEVWPYLTPLSRKSPPTHCQLLFYYTRLRARMNEHRDNASKSTLHDIAKRNGLSLFEGHASGTDENSQVPGTNVVVFTTGDIGQNFSLHAVDGSILYEADRSEHVASRTWRLDWGTVCVLDPTDDLTMTHEALFVNKETGHVRKAWVFRWLQSARHFSKDSGKRAVDDVE